MNVFPVAIIVAAGLWACDAKSPPGPPPASNLRVVASMPNDVVHAWNIAVIHDDDRGVTCYWDGHSLSCLPDVALASKGRP